ncbi:16S rRNA (uracil(1498)-N(3))-methyltransferase [Borreliella yangtzensis]|uniref:Ribosomal RNA small subunit methyltransferase E n=2 Tax=Borreliella TaxID=64895 RepID=A0ABR6P9C7_9SPIR|nr:16S rRNA (uracil(1498)-N(3))-methyltransferase [Borreliella yangtzensis]MBB6042891.1 16S rRNA (uracil1498-N3)-methyltransferase [Borreliella yangtzensis]WKC73330.1 16S rRNA (uracil(1498)-N(3))-methyltransferase [Borreliella yangtzensis]WKC74247.1 16S rRNA (uracil(1498)-N(3))-methyltransferase [Borreliella yangtzensis]
MKQIVLDANCLVGDFIIVKDMRIYHHLINVRRLKKGDKLKILLKGKELRVSEIVKIGSNFIEFATNKIDKIEKNNFEISIFISSLKGKKIDSILRQIVEIGVSEINIINADRSVSKIDISSTSAKTLRFSKIIDEALKQSGNKIVPKINFYNSFFYLPYSFCTTKYYVAHQSGMLLGKNESFENFSKIGIIIGPEGCFSDSEISFFKEKDFNFVRFNTPILRADTAIIYSLAYFKALLEDCNG